MEDAAERKQCGARPLLAFTPLPTPGVFMDRTTRDCSCMSIAYTHVTEAAASRHGTPDKSARGVAAVFHRASWAAAPFIRTRSAFLLALPTAGNGPASSVPGPPPMTARRQPCSAQQSLPSVQYPRFKFRSPVPTPEQEGRTGGENRPPCGPDETGTERMCPTE